MGAMVSKGDEADSLQSNVQMDSFQLFQSYCLVYWPVLATPHPVSLRVYPSSDHVDEWGLMSSLLLIARCFHASSPCLALMPSSELSIPMLV